MTVAAGLQELRKLSPLDAVQPKLRAASELPRCDPATSSRIPLGYSLVRLPVVLGGMSRAACGGGVGWPGARCMPAFVCLFQALRASQL